MSSGSYAAELTTICSVIYQMLRLCISPAGAETMLRSASYAWRRLQSRERSAARKNAPIDIQCYKISANYHKAALLWRRSALDLSHSERLTASRGPDPPRVRSGSELCVRILRGQFSSSGNNRDSDPEDRLRGCCAPHSLRSRRSCSAFPPEPPRSSRILSISTCYGSIFFTLPK